MIVVKVELHSAITHEVTELARMIIANDGTGDGALRNYDGVSLRGRNKNALDNAQRTNAFTRKGRVEKYPAERFHVWNLVARMLGKMGYEE